MGRKTKTLEEKKCKISITILPEIDKELDDLNINKSKLINWLLNEYFNTVKI
jgi:hypothetical protein